MPKLTDEQIVQALERLKSTKDFLWEEYQEKIKTCSYPELKLIIRQTYEDNKEAFNIAIGAIEENNRLKAEISVKNKLLDKAEETIVNAKTEAYKEFVERADKVVADLKYYLDTNEEKGVVYIPDFVVEKMIKNLKEKVGEG